MSGPRPAGSDAASPHLAGAQADAMRERQAAVLLHEASSLFDALQATRRRRDRARILAQFWFSLNQAWSLLTGAKPTGSLTLH